MWKRVNQACNGGMENLEGKRIKTENMAVKWLQKLWWHDRILAGKQPCCRVADLYSYIEWGWCWWTRDHLILKTWWLLECSFWHCWHSFLWIWSSVLKHRKTTRKLWRVAGWQFYFPFCEVKPLCGRLFSSFLTLNIAYLSARCKR